MEGNPKPVAQAAPELLVVEVEGMMLSQSPAWGKLEDKVSARERQVGAESRSCWKQASSTT